MCMCIRVQSHDYTVRLHACTVYTFSRGGFRGPEPEPPFSMKCTCTLCTKYNTVQTGTVHRLCCAIAGSALCTADCQSTCTSTWCYTREPDNVAGCIIQVSKLLWDKVRAIHRQGYISAMGRCKAFKEWLAKNFFHKENWQQCPYTELRGGDWLVLVRCLVHFCKMTVHVCLTRAAWPKSVYCCLIRGLVLRNPLDQPISMLCEQCKVYG